MHDSRPGSPVLYYLLEFAQMRMHWVMMLSNHLHPLWPPSPFASIRVVSSKSALHIRWPKYWSFSFNISPSNERSELISFRMDWLDLLVLAKHCGTLAPVGCFCYSFPSFMRKSQQSRCQSWAAGDSHPGPLMPLNYHVCDQGPSTALHQ